MIDYLAITFFWQMSGSIKYKILKERKIVIHLYEGEISINDIKENANRLMVDMDFRPEFNEITDLRNSELVFDHNDDINDYVKFVKTQMGYIWERKIAVLATSPDHVVKSTLYKKVGHLLPMKLQVFSTFYSALNYLNVTDFSEHEFNSIIEELKTMSVSARSKNSTENTGSRVNF